MAQQILVTVGPNVLKTTGSLLLGAIGVAGGLVLIFGTNNSVVLTIAAIVFAIGIVAAVVSLIRQRPRLDLTSDGFIFHKLFGSTAYEWQNIEGPFAVITVGLIKSVGFKFTEAYKAAKNFRPSPAFGGYDAAIPGSLKISPEDLVVLLNKQQEQAKTRRA